MARCLPVSAIVGGALGGIVFLAFVGVTVTAPVVF